jgi:hypothetical protein
MRWLGRGRGYTPKRYETEQKGVVEKETTIYDPRFRFDILTVEYIKRFKLQNNIMPVLNIPLAYNQSRGVFEIVSAPSLVEARIKGYYYGATLPSIIEPGYYSPALDSRARTLVNILLRDVAPVWVHGDEVTAPAAGTELVSKTVSDGKTGYIYGFFISAGEANDFKINFTTGRVARSIRIPLAGKGVIHYLDFIPMNEGMAADGGSSITITNVNAGGAGVVYQARLLYAEV